jgi:CheY-like chemotaxis protein
MSHTICAGAVLLVEDEGLTRVVVADVLQERGIRIYEAENADEAISLLEKHPDIGLIFTDINLPGSMDGIRLVHAVRNRWPPVKIVVASGNVIPAEGDLPSESIFIPKPYIPEFVAARILKMMA